MAPRQSRADLHVHPAGDRWIDSDEYAGFLDAIARSDVDAVALTDHDRIDVALALAAEVADDESCPVHIIVGQEISTESGHLLGLFLTDRVEPGMTLSDSVAAVHDQDGLAVVPHPRLPTSISVPGRLLADLAQSETRRRPDAIESFNPMAAWIPLEVSWIARFARHHGYALTGGSDGHRPADVGRGFTTFTGTDTADLRAAILARQTTGNGKPYGVRDASRGVIGQVRGGVVRPTRH